ncbi:hypothetical protein HDV06_006646 [Boothiomyces sp. JEL0866]|nr:hypothetical protein HDV06_006646 [Boothiomyces sp. JEL0866]
MSNLIPLAIALIILFVLLRVLIKPQAITTEQIDQIQAMFPNVSRQSIINDLQNTRSTHLTIENIMNGNLPTVQTPQVTPQQPKVQQKKADISKYLTDEVIQAPTAEWTDNAEKRAEQLLQRKKYMLQQARLKMKAKSE